MLHRNVYACVDTETDEDLGIVCICPLPENDKQYGYYLRRNDSSYELIKKLVGMSAAECKIYERTELLQEALTMLHVKNVEDCKLYRVHRSVWNESALIDPEITSSNWINSQLAFFFEENED